MDTIPVNFLSTSGMPFFFFLAMFLAEDWGTLVLLFGKEKVNGNLVGGLVSELEDVSCGRLTGTFQVFLGDV